MRTTLSGSTVLDGQLPQQAALDGQLPQQVSLLPVPAQLALPVPPSGRDLSGAPVPLLHPVPSRFYPDLGPSLPQVFYHPEEASSSPGGSGLLSKIFPLGSWWQ